ncbi:MAG: DUF6036 family nucleotidyltransferase [Campylobacterota bacterium]|nr:DUF6036 family nucleotidyltransferase [Campylobacterota bacterium]
MYLTQDYKDIIELFNKHDVKFLIAGAYAMSKVGYSRSTYDIDLWIEKTKQNAINIFHALEEFGVPFKIDPDDFLAPNSVLQIGIEPNRIDILTDIDGLTFAQAWKNKQLVEFNEISAYSLEIHDIIKNKTASNRPKDRLDLVQLKELAKLL